MKSDCLSPNNDEAAIVAQPSSFTGDAMNRDHLVVQETRKKVSDSYDVANFTKKHGISTTDAARIINLHRSDRDSADRAAYRLKNTL
jgi:hypothetical protein